VTCEHERRISRVTKKSPPAIYYDYRNRTFERAQAPEAHQPSLDALLCGLKKHRPGFDGEVKKRHKRLKALFERALSARKAATNQSQPARIVDSAPEPPARKEAAGTRLPKPGRNVTCPCGSGKKYKRCCGR
jgi:preprotein translocase subunit SecA